VIRTYPDENANIVDIDAFRGDVENAFLYLQQAAIHKDPTLNEALYYPTFKILYKDPRWKALQKQMGLPKINGIPTA
jgi:adenylate cyclase